MAIDSVEIKDFLVFKGKFVADFCSGVNVLIGANATGKTTLMKALYYGADRFSKPKKFPEILQKYFGIIEEDYNTADYANGSKADFLSTITEKFGMITMKVDNEELSLSYFKQPRNDKITLNPVYIPEKDILEHAKGLLTFIEDKQTGFSSIYKLMLRTIRKSKTKVHIKTGIMV
jgi:AAA15 family ATPase/GTPase